MFNLNSILFYVVKEKEQNNYTILSQLLRNGTRRTDIEPHHFFLEIFISTLLVVMLLKE